MYKSYGVFLVFYHNYVSLCRSRGLSPSAAAEAMGFKRSIVTKRANGSTPHKSTLYTIADFFGTTVEELLKDTPPNEDFPEVTMIGRASKKMSQADREKMLQLIRIAFPEAFDD